MKFTDTEILEIVKKPKNSSDVENGRKYESRLRLFTEPKFKGDLQGKEIAWKEFTSFMDDVLSIEKSSRIKDFIQYPLSSIGITESLMSELYKVFNAGNAYFNVGTVKKSGGEKMQKLLQDLNITQWIEEEGKEVLKNKPNTVVVIDKNEHGEPYILSIDNDRLLDIKLKDDGVSCDYVMFVHSETENEAGDDEVRIALYDEENYNVIVEVKGEYSIETSVPHNIGYCPARMFLKEKLNSKARFNRKVPLSSALSKIQEWQYFDIYKFYTDHYAPFPVTEMLRSSCGGDTCNKGWIEHREVYVVDGETRDNVTRSKCKACESNNFVGVGAKILIDPVDDDQESASGKFKMTSNPVENLKYLQDKLDFIESYIKVKVVGIDDAVNKEAVNELQVKGSFESRTNVLLRIKSNLDELYVWIVTTIGNTFIKGQPLSVEANFGTEWYLISEIELQERFKEAKLAGLPTSELNEIYLQIVETKYKGNPDKIERLKIINRIDSCPFDTMEGKLARLANGVISKAELIISSRMLTFVSRFEFEQGSIVEFGEDIEPRIKYQKIYEQFKIYADEYIRENETEPIGSGGETS